jgi:ATP-dependent Clp protease ATP-binding subunit ClpX
VDTTDVNEAGLPYRNMVNIKMIKEDDETAIYYMDDSIPNVVLNEKAVREIMDAKTLKKAKLLLTKYQKGLESIKKCKDNLGITRVSISGSKINYYETNMNVDLDSIDEACWSEPETTNIIPVTSNTEISYQGLKNYLKERIFGHDEEIDTFAQKLYMNHTAEDGESVESILFVGPTGTGKTVTVRSACEYLGIPMSEANASNLVTQGIMGTSIEDVITALYERSGCDLKRAQRGLIFLDEFDKLSETTLETKTPVKNILLTFTAGGTFPINNGHYNFVFNSTMTNKVYAGVFERVTDKTNPMGFGAVKKISPLASSDEELRKKIIEKKYFTNEELTRISTILPYNDLSKEDKKDALLHSKLSEYTNKRDRYKRQFGIDLVLEDEYIDAVIDKLSSTTGMRSIYNYVKKNLNVAERAILENEDKGYKKLVLTKDAVLDPKNFDLSK